MYLITTLDLKYKNDSFLLFTSFSFLLFFFIFLWPSFKCLKTFKTVTLNLVILFLSRFLKDFTEFLHFLINLDGWNLVKGIHNYWTIDKSRLNKLIHLRCLNHIQKIFSIHLVHHIINRNLSITSIWLWGLLNVFEVHEWIHKFENWFYLLIWN